MNRIEGNGNRRRFSPFRAATVAWHNQQAAGLHTSVWKPNLPQLLITCTKKELSGQGAGKTRKKRKQASVQALPTKHVEPFLFAGSHEVRRNLDYIV